jgi:hypothetical protein
MTGLTNQTLRREISGSKTTQSRFRKRWLTTRAADQRVIARQPVRFESVRSHASAWVTMVCRSLKRGCHPSVERTRSQVATIRAGSTPAMLRGHIRFLRRLAVELVGRLLNGCHLA